MRLILILFSISSLLLAEGGLLKVNWSKVSTIKQKVKVLPKGLREGIRDVTLPVYMPRYYIYEKGISIVSDENFYNIIIPLKGARLMVSGDRTYQDRIDLKDKQKAEKLKSITGKFIQSEGMMSVDFQRNGVNYSMVIECDNPSIDPRCKDERFLKKIYNGLIFIGGKRR